MTQHLHTFQKSIKNQANTWHLQVIITSKLTKDIESVQQVNRMLTDLSFSTSLKQTTS